jgi:hypothetical protein
MVDVLLGSDVAVWEGAASTEAEMIDKPPPWHCDTPAEQDRFERWINARLDEMNRTTWVEFSEEEMDQAEAEWAAREQQERLQHIHELIQTKDIDALVRWMGRDEKVLRYAVGRMLYPPRRKGEPGRKPGESRPRDLSEGMRLARQRAAHCRQQIFDLFRRHWDKDHRNLPPTADAMAARRAGISLKDLERHLKK